MRTAYLDMFSGVSGDMLLGACLDAGVELEELEATLEPLGLEGVRLGVERIERHGIVATRCLVEVEDAAGHRGLAEILDLLERAALPERVVERSARVFRRLAEAEAKVHDTTPDAVRFHEVGALDAIVDVVGGVWCLDRLRVERLHASAFTLGSGWVDAAHGRLPVPVPAVWELVAGWPVSGGDVAHELTTPTGAALVTTLATSRGVPLDFVPEVTGYGAGTREIEDRPNLLRLVVGEDAGEAGELAVVECDLDDLVPELFEPVADALYEAGAREVIWVPVQMKKRRPGVTIRALAPVERVEAVGRALLRESTTLGYRWWVARRETLAREAIEVDTSLGRVEAKRIRRPDGRWEVRPEYDACRRIARERDLPVREVRRTLERELAVIGDA
ncbi:MAG: nickel pincer cofactor biosynthesis protein LarC [Gemmatimonadota bacterium]|nr:nickel pincer cofactor biosynthesis protein LarC [Gemmatimonadota bacterium]